MTLLAIAMLLVACGDDGPIEGADAGDAGGGDAGVVEPACAAGSLTGEAPFARRVAGEIRLDPELGGGEAPQVRSFAATVWFPSGRVGGAEAMLAYESWWPRRGLRVSTSIVTEDGAVTFVLSGYYADTELDGVARLDEGSDALVLDARHWNLSETDVVEAWKGVAALCATDEPVAEPTLDALDHSVLLPPIAPIWLRPSVPIDPDALHVSVVAGGAPLDVTVELADNIVVITPAGLFPPSAPLEVDVGGTLDVLGRPVALGVPPAAMITTAVVSDLTFETEPDVGALAGYATWVDGLVIVDSLAVFDQAVGMVALGDLPGTTVVVTARLTCTRPFEDAAIVSADGAVSPLRFECLESRKTPDEVVRVPRPGSGPMWLVVWTPDRRRPQWGPWFGDGRISIDAIGIE